MEAHPSLLLEQQIMPMNHLDTALLYRKDDSDDKDADFASPPIPASTPPHTVVPPTSAAPLATHQLPDC